MYSMYSMAQYNVCEINYSHIVVCKNNYSHIVVYENNCSHIVRKTQCLNNYFCTQCRIKINPKKSPIYGTLAGLPTQRVWKTSIRGITGYFMGVFRIDHIK